MCNYYFSMISPPNVIYNPSSANPESGTVEFYQPGGAVYVSDINGPISRNYYSAEGWQLCSGPSLRGHIVNAHLRPDVLDGIGLPLFDVEVA